MLAVSMGTVDLFNFSFKFILLGGAFEGEIHGNLSNMCMCWVMSVSPVENKYTDSDEINYLKNKEGLTNISVIPKHAFMMKLILELNFTFLFRTLNLKLYFEANTTISELLFWLWNVFKWRNFHITCTFRSFYTIMMNIIRKIQLLYVVWFPSARVSTLNLIYRSISMLNLYHYSWSQFIDNSDSF